MRASTATLVRSDLSTYPPFDAGTWIGRARSAGLHIQAEVGGLILGLPDASAHPAVYGWQRELYGEIRAAAGERAVWRVLRT